MDYNIGPNTYRIDRPNHFFIINGPLVWSGISENEWIAAKSLRDVQREGFKTSDLNRMSPIGPHARPNTVNTAIQAFKNISPASDAALATISGREDLVRVIREMASR
jgi:hypothetical protein